MAPWEAGKPHHSPKSCKKGKGVREEWPQNRKRSVWGTLHNKGRLIACAFLKGAVAEEACCPGWMVNMTIRMCAGRVTHNIAWGRGSSYSISVWTSRSDVPPRMDRCMYACRWLGIYNADVALSKDGSRKRVKDTGELTKMTDINAP